LDSPPISRRRTTKRYTPSFDKGLLLVGAEICNPENNTFGDIEASKQWNKIGKWVHYDSKTYFEEEGRLLILMHLLISRITSLDKNVQRTLMQIIENGTKGSYTNENINSTVYESANNSDETYLDDLDIDNDDNDNESLLDALPST